MRLIDANRYAERLQNIMACWKCSPCLSPEEVRSAVGDLKVALQELSDMPTIGPESLVAHSEWVMIPVDGAAKFRCGNVECCRLIPFGCSPSDLHYCPFCGSKMDLKE